MRAGAKAEPKARLGKRARPAAAQPALAEDPSRRGLRATRQRLALLRLLRAADGHPTALDLYRTLRREQRSVSQKTVYEILNSASSSRRRPPPTRTRTAPSPWARSRPVSTSCCRPRRSN